MRKHEGVVSLSIAKHSLAVTAYRFQKSQVLSSSLQQNFSTFDFACYQMFDSHFRCQALLIRENSSSELTSFAIW